jgi:hypothetical protein
MNLKFKTAMIGNREHVILDNANNLSDFRGKFAELKHLACSVADHLNKPVTIPAFLVVDDIASIENIKMLLAEKCINPIVINTQTNTNSVARSEPDENSQKMMMNGYIDSRNRYNQQQHPFLIQTLNNGNKKPTGVDSVNATPPQNTVIQPVVKTEEEVAVKVEKVADKPARKPRAPRTKKAATLTNGAVFAPAQNGVNTSPHVTNIINPQVYDPSQAINKQPSQTCAEILLKTIDSSNISSSNANSNMFTPGKMSQNAPNAIMINNSTTPNQNKLEQKKPRIQKINEILMSSSNSSQVTQMVNGNTQHQPMNQMINQNVMPNGCDNNKNNVNMMIDSGMMHQTPNGSLVNGVDQQMEHQIQQAVETFNSMDQSLGMHQFIDQGPSSSMLSGGHLGDHGLDKPSSANNTMSFMNDNMDTFVDMSNGAHMFVNGSANGNANKMMMIGGGNNSSGGNNFNASHDYSFNFDPFDTNVLFSTNLNDLEV